MKLTELKKYKKILILGYGKEGQATKKFLNKFFPKAKVGIADKRFNLQYLQEQEKYDLIIRSPGIPKELITRPYTTASNIFMANVRNITVGVTGTKGKSTTVSLIRDILKEAGKPVCLAGNIGAPMLEEMLKPIDKNNIYVIEFSSYQLDDIQYSPHISVILDLFPEHMDYHGSVKNYYLAKKNIIAYAKKNDFYLYNPQYSTLKIWAKQTQAISLPFVKNIPINNKSIPLLGEHNKDNIRAAVTVARVLNIKNNIISFAIKKFKPLPHRLQYVGTYKNIVFYDDAISTTPESTVFAIKTLKNIGTIFLGGVDRGYDFSYLVDLILKDQIPNLVFFPDSGKRILALLRSKIKRLPNILLTDKMEEAVRFAYEKTAKRTICLLSCASPSYSLWKNFEEKGDQFSYWVKKYSKYVK